MPAKKSPRTTRKSRAGTETAARKPGDARAGTGGRDAARKVAARRPRPSRPSDADIDLTAVRIVDDRRFSGKYQVVEDEGERRVLGWGFGSAAAARRWLQVQNRMSSWLRLVLRDEPGS